MNNLTLLSLTLILLFSACKKEVSEIPTVTCDFSTLTATSISAYSFDDNLAEHFHQTDRWESIDATLIQANNKMELSASGTSISEAWLTHVQQMPYNQSWTISADVTVPIYWNTASGTEPQVGVGIYVGKPEASGPSKKVYECNLAVVGNGERFVQGQLVANRLGGDPVKVDRKILANTRETVRMKLQFCGDSHTVTLLIDDEIIGTQAIDSSGNDNWGLGDSGLMDIGIMGFAENTNLMTNAPSIDAFELNKF